MTISDARLGQIASRFAELEARLASGTLEGTDFVTASRDYAELEPVARAAAAVGAMRDELANLTQMAEADPEMREMAAAAALGAAAAATAAASLTSILDAKRILY